MQAGFPGQDELARALACRPHPRPGEARHDAAVLACLTDQRLLLVRRRRDPRDKWSGHVGLPGGRYEPGDVTLLDTALRETREEVGFHALDHGRLLGSLGTYLARHREPADLAIAVFVAVLDDVPTLTLSNEIASAHWVALAQLQAGEAEVSEYAAPVPAYVPRVDGEPMVIWGITFGILERLRALG